MDYIRSSSIGSFFQQIAKSYRDSEFYLNSKTAELANALEYGEVSTIAALASAGEISQLDLNKLQHLLAAKDARGIPGLYFALQNGHAGAITAYRTLLELLPEEPRVVLLPELLAAKDARGIPGLYFALQNDHAGAITAYRTLLELLPEERRAVLLPELLAAKDARGIPGLCFAVARGHADALTAYRTLLELLSSDDRDKLIDLLNTAIKSSSEVRKFLDNKDGEVIKTYADFHTLTNTWRTTKLVYDDVVQVGSNKLGDLANDLICVAESDEAPQSLPQVRFSGEIDTEKKPKKFEFYDEL